MVSAAICRIISAAVSLVTGPRDTAAVSLVSFDRGMAAVLVAQRQLQAIDTAAVARVTATCDTAAVSLGLAIFILVRISSPNWP